MPQDSNDAVAAPGISLWKLIAWTTAILVGLWVSITAVQRYRMEKLRTEVESRGGRLEGQVIQPRWYSWLATKVPNGWPRQTVLKFSDSFRRVVHVHLPEGSFLPPDFVSRLSIFRQVQQLDLPNCDLSDADLEKLSAFSELHHLNLNGNRVSDRGLAELDRLPFLRTLELGQTRVGDGVLHQVSSLKSLVSLNVSATLVTDDGLRAMGSPPSLRYLYLSGSRISDSGLSAMDAQPVLILLELTGCPISDQGLREINDSRFPSLQSLNVAETQVTADGIADMKLNGLRELKWLTFPHVRMMDHHWLSLATVKSLVRLNWGDVQLRREFIWLPASRSRMPLDSFEVVGIPGRDFYPRRSKPFFSR